MVNFSARYENPICKGFKFLKTFAGNHYSDSHVSWMIILIAN